MMGLIFFVILYGYKSELTREIRSIKIIVEKVRMLIVKFQKLYIELVIDIRFISEKIIIYQNKKCEDILPFREGEKIYLL